MLPRSTTGPVSSTQNLILSLCEYKTVDTRMTTTPPGCTFGSTGAGVYKETNNSRDHSNQMCCECVLTLQAVLTFDNSGGAETSRGGGQSKY